MLKKLISLVLSLCLISGVSVMAENTAADENTPAVSSQMLPQNQSDFQGMQPPENFDPSKMPEGFSPPMGGDGNFRGGMGGFPGEMKNNSQNAEQKDFLGFVKTYSTPITSVVLLAFAYLFVIFYKRKHY